MKKLTLLFLTVTIIWSTNSFAGGKFLKLEKKFSGEKIAIVSLGIANNTKIQSQKKLKKNEAALLQVEEGFKYIESHLSKNWELVPFSSFSADEQYHALAKKDFDFMHPTHEEKSMKMFSKKHTHAAKGKIDSDTIQKLAQISQSDYVMVIFSGWNVGTGKFIPTSKAQAKTRITIYNKSGKRVFTEYQQALGDRTLGAGGIAAASDDTMPEWGIAFKKSVDKILK